MRITSGMSSKSSSSSRRLGRVWRWHWSVPVKVHTQTSGLLHGSVGQGPSSDKEKHFSSTTLAFLTRETEVILKNSSVILHKRKTSHAVIYGSIILHSTRKQYWTMCTTTLFHNIHEYTSPYSDNCCILQCKYQYELPTTVFRTITWALLDSIYIRVKTGSPMKWLVLGWVTTKEDRPLLCLASCDFMAPNKCDYFITSYHHQVRL
jgi:hypothetical protein